MSDTLSPVTNWTAQYDRLIESLEREVPRGSYNLQSVPRITDDLRDEIRDVMSMFRGFTVEKYREYFMRLTMVEQHAKMKLLLPPQTNGVYL
jgi:hypothetical protein